MLSTCEETLRQEFSRFRPGSVERVKKLTDYAFVHYRCRDDAITALSLMNGAQIDGATVEVTLAKPGTQRGAEPNCAARAGAELQQQQGVPGEPKWRRRGRGGAYVLHREGGGRDSCSPLRNMPLPPRLESPYFSERSVFPLFPGTPLSPISLLSLKQSQIGSAVNLLYFHCQKNCWTDPEFQLYSTPGPDGKLLLLYKVMISSTRSTYIPDKLCVLLEEAKELAAQTTLWNLGTHTHTQTHTHRHTLTHTNRHTHTQTDTHRHTHTHTHTLKPD
ncbi:putative RNA-binding protein 46 [Dissostichus eleginoides]|uniref:RNA-binding protein 46 n=1 Tax=Dissostichus eleginoides TaxID=100907 RepID=A0AAD9BUB7_DISEL|nr:putative RNA-binding protein 46 [Dissostichus eleginoides]